jgi:hypothetical protein
MIEMSNWYCRKASPMDCKLSKFRSRKMILCCQLLRYITYEAVSQEVSSLCFQRFLDFPQPRVFPDDPLFYSVPGLENESLAAWYCAAPALALTVLLVFNNASFMSRLKEYERISFTARDFQTVFHYTYFRLAIVLFTRYLILFV